MGVVEVGGGEGAVGVDRTSLNSSVSRGSRGSRSTSSSTSSRSSMESRGQYLPHLSARCSIRLKSGAAGASEVRERGVTQSTRRNIKKGNKGNNSNNGKAPKIVDNKDTNVGIR